MNSAPLISAKNITVAGIVALTSLLAALGFTSPKEKLEDVKRSVIEVKTEVAGVRKDVAGHDLQLALQKQDIGYIMDGIDDLRGLSVDERKAKRRRRRGDAQ